MAPQTTQSSSSTRMGDMNMNRNDISVEPRIDLSYLMTQLCDIAKVPTNGYDICGKSFGESLLHYLREKEKTWKQGKRLMEDLLIGLDTPRPFKCEIQATKPPPECHSNDHEKSSDLTQTQPNENNELVEDDLVSPSPEVIIIPPTPLHKTSLNSSPAKSCTSYVTSYAPTPVRTEQVIPQNGDVNNRDSSHSYASPKLSGEDHQFVVPTTAVIFRKPQSSKRHEVEILSGEQDNLIDNLSQSPPSTSSRQLRPKNKEARNYNDDSDYEDTFPRVSKKINQRTDRQVLKSMHHAARDGVGLFQCICSSKKFSSKQARNHHINYYMAEWKFKCTECQEKFYKLAVLKMHMIKKHDNTTLEQFVIGDPETGNMFKTRVEFSDYKKREKAKLASTNQKKHQFARALVNKSSRFLGMPHLSPGMSPRRPGMSPRRPGMSPRRPGMSPRRPGMSPRRPGMSPRRPGMSPRRSQPWMATGRQKSTPKYSMFMPSREMEIDRQDQTNDMSHEVLPLNRHDSIPIELSDQEHHQGAQNSENVDTSHGFSDITICKRSGKLYACVVCSQVFPNDLEMLRRHLTEQHNIDCKEVRCGKCQRVFGTCKTFHQHWDIAKH